jgi:hypothetical protein
VRIFSLLSAAALAAVALEAGAALAQVKPDTAGIKTQSVEVDAHPLATFDKGGAPGGTGKLAFRGGLELTSPSENFGGWSGLALDNDGKGFVAISDSGTWMTGEIAYDGGKPAGIKGARIGAILAKGSKPLAKDRDRDAEGITLEDGSIAVGSVYIAFEQNDRIGVYPIGKKGISAPSRYLEMPKDARRMRMDGIEGLTVLKGGPHKGSLVAFAENALPGDTQHKGWIWIGDKPNAFVVPGIGDYGVTDAAALSDGSVLILERRFRWTDGVKIRLRHLAAEGFEPGGNVTGEVLLDADQSKEIDNLEALAVRETADEVLITIMSDDNFNHLLQRTLLLQFALKRAPAASKAKTAAGN